MPADQTAVPLRVVRLLVPDARSTSVREQVARERAALDPRDEDRALDWIDAVSEFSSEDGVQATISLDDDLVERARAVTGLTEPSALVREALFALIERESARRLVTLGGSDPAATAPPRRG